MCMCILTTLKCHTQLLGQVLQIKIRFRIINTFSWHEWNWNLLWEPLALHEKCSYLEIFQSVFSRIWAKYGDLQSKSPYSVPMREKWTRKTTNTDIFYAVLTIKIYWWWHQSWLYTANESQANHLIKVIVSMMLAFNQGEWLLRLFQFHTAYGSLI